MAERGPLSVLIVEDESMVATLLRRGVEAAGHAVFARVATVAEAVALIESGPPGFDAALLDANLGGAPATAVAAALRAAGVPYLVVTGYSAEEARALGVDGPVLRKPFRMAALARALDALSG